jgi:hypothetical protein
MNVVSELIIGKQLDAKTFRHLNTWLLRGQKVSCQYYQPHTCHQEVTRGASKMGKTTL